MGHGGGRRGDDQRRQAGGEDDAVELPSFPVQRGAAVAERNRLQPREPVAALGAAQQNRQLVADQLATAIGENRRSIGQARSVLLVAPGGKSSDTAAVWKHGAPDRRAAGACGVVEAAQQGEKSINN